MAQFHIPLGLGAAMLAQSGNLHIDFTLACRRLFAGSSDTPIIFQLFLRGHFPGAAMVTQLPLE